MEHDVVYNLLAFLGPATWVLLLASRGLGGILETFFDSH